MMNFYQTVLYNAHGQHQCHVYLERNSRGTIIVLEEVYPESNWLLCMLSCSSIRTSLINFFTFWSAAYKFHIPDGMKLRFVTQPSRETSVQSQFWISKFFQAFSSAFGRPHRQIMSGCRPPLKAKVRKAVPMKFVLYSSYFLWVLYSTLP